MVLAAGLVLILGGGCGSWHHDLRKARSYMEAGRYPAAARTWDRVLGARPGQPEALVGAAEAWSRAGDDEAALKRAQAARAAHAPDADLALPRALVGAGRGAEALDLLPDAPTGPPTDPELAQLLAEARLANHDPQGALAGLEGRGEDGPTQVLRAWLVVRARGDAGCDQALPLAQGAARSADQDVEVVSEAAWLAARCDATEPAAELRRRARPLEQPSLDRRRAAAAQRLAGGDAEGAARMLARAQALYPQQGLAVRDLGVAFLGAGAPAEAVRSLREALLLPPYAQDPLHEQPVEGGFGLDPAPRAALVEDLWRTLSVALQRAGDPVNAAAAHERSLRLDPQADAPAWTRLARELQAAGLSTRALAAARTAVRMDGNDLQAWLAQAEILLASDDPSQAEGPARSAWAIEPGRPEVAVALARAALANYQPEEATRACETALAGLRGAAHPLVPTLHALLRQADASRPAPPAP